MRTKNIFPSIEHLPEPNFIKKPLRQVEFLINGIIEKWNGPFEKVYSPVYGVDEEKAVNEIGSYPLLSGCVALKALDAARKAYDSGRGEWPAMSVESRIEHIRRFVIKMKSKREEVVQLLMWEIGKSRKDSEKEFDRTVDYINDTIEALKQLDRISSRFTISQGIIAQVRRAPLGVVLCMGPYNYPLNETFTTLLPALIMGNTVIFKPPKMGVLLHKPLLDAFAESFPAGVINTVYGDGQEVIAPLMESGFVDVLAFIGSSKVADILKKQHPKPHRMKSILGLEAKNPAIILPDADMDQAINECVTGALSYNGQRCTALKILFVHDSVYDDFVGRFKDEVEKLKVGLPWDKDVQITPLPEPGKTEYLDSLVNDATEKGAKLLNNYKEKSDFSFFFPAIVSGVKSNMRLYHEEQFGPVIPIVKYSNLDEPLEYVVNSNYGQQASIFGENTSEIARLVDTLVNQVCRVNINSQCQRGPDELPFTGRKDSAEGTLSVSDALRVFSIRTLVALKETAGNKEILTDILKENRSTFLSTDFIF
ncbi:MAG: NADP-dependent glyceraldehyde-3-phosphate dehydrogenase [Marinilabiliales bacterium]|nr:MAG: NADP-dependent glyceraldehyde-3-phosphate dehydrogenase [Marinilabiliales bacterium]